MALNISKVEITALPKAAQTSFIEVVVLIVIIGLFYWFMVLPKAASLQTQTKAYEAAQKRQQSSAHELKNLESLISQLKSSQKEVVRLDEALPLDGKTTKLQMLIEYMAGTSGLTVGGVNVSGKGDTILAGDKALLSQPFKPKRSLQKMSVSIFVTGTFDQLQTFLKKIESNSRIMDVASLDIGPAQEGLLSLRLSVDSYYFVP